MNSRRWWFFLEECHSNLPRILVPRHRDTQHAWKNSHSVWVLQFKRYPFKTHVRKCWMRQGLWHFPNMQWEPSSWPPSLQNLSTHMNTKLYVSDNVGQILEYARNDLNFQTVTYAHTFVTFVQILGYAQPTLSPHHIHIWNIVMYISICWIMCFLKYH